MKKIIEINRVAAGVEDLAWGQGKVTQTRGGKEVEVTLINAMDIPYGENRTIADVIANGTQGLGIFTTSSVLIVNGVKDIEKATIVIPGDKVIQVNDLILDGLQILGKVTKIIGTKVRVEYYATLKGDKGD